MIKDLSLPGLKSISLKIFHDERGFFVERFRQDLFKSLGLETDFVQDNHSRSKPGVIRGLHYQHSPSQGKLVGVTRGRVFDVVVDLRADSPTYGKCESIELSDENGLLLWVPKGFAHGFCVTGNEDADLMYKVDAAYSPKTEGGIHYADPDLNISWPVQNPFVSKKDHELQNFKTYEMNRVF